MSGPPHDWPERRASFRVRCLPHDWHVQRWGNGADLLLLHGAGASAHSWHLLVPHLAGYRCIAPDLPGQGFTRAGNRQRLGLDAMAEDIAALCQGQGWQPAAIIGHSAGAALALRLAEILPQPPACTVGINAALGPFDGIAGWLFPMLARIMATSPFVGRGIAHFAARPDRVARLITQTGSKADPERVALYARLIANPGHVEATLGMMAQWSLDALLTRLPDMAIPLQLIAGKDDLAVPPLVSRKVAACKPATELIEIEGQGHLIHEETPERVASEILRFLDRHLTARKALLR